MITKDCLSFQVDARQGAMEAAMVEASMRAILLAHMAWAGGDDTPVWTPERAWLDEMTAHARAIDAALGELRSALDCV